MARFFSILLLLQLALAAWAQPEPPEPPIRLDEESHRSDREGHREQRRHARDRQTMGEDVVVRTNEVAGNLVLFGGSLDVQGTVDGDIVMIGGPVKVSGEVTGGVVLVGGALTASGTIERDVVVVLGGGEFKEGAKLESSAVLIGGPFMFDARSELLGEKVTIPLGDVLPKVQWFKAWVVSGPLLGRLLPFNVTWPWMVAGFALTFYLLVLILFPAAIRGAYLALENRPIASILAGLITVILFAPLVVVLAMTVVGIPAIPFVKIALILAAIIGKTAVICFLGRALGRATGGTSLQAPFLAFVAGAILLTLIYTVPVLGLTAWALATVFGLGAALVALGQSLGREEASAAPVAVPVQTLRPELAVAGGGSAEQVAVAMQPPLVGTSGLGPADTLMLRRAGFWRRFLASILDLILITLLIPAVGPFFIPIGILYFVAMWTWKGTTIGSIVLGLKVIRTDGRPMNFSVSLVRSLSSLFSLFVLGLGFLWAAWDREKQTWHDKIAGTIVVRMPSDFALI
jgi:uncharacterized RDD family membrane protein YckC